jgi:hypothetical protein
VNLIDRNTSVIAHNAQRTSILAANEIYPKSGTIRRKVYEYFLSRGLRGGTDQEAEVTLGIDGNTIRPSRGSLVKDGWLIDSGTTRPNDKGHACIVWRAVEQLEQGQLL